MNGRALSGQEILHIWEVGQRQHPLDRALTILTVAFPGVSREALLTLSIGRRDAYLLTLRTHNFGWQLVSLATCPSCQEQLEISLLVADLLDAQPEQAADGVYIVSVDEYTFHVRLPNSLDLAAIVRSRDLDTARTHLMRRCIVQSMKDGLEVELAMLPEHVLATLSTHIEALDPLSEVHTDLDCPACGTRWQLLFDIVTFLWTEISVQARRLLREVHTLAHVYGWHEADILSMNPIRRQFYLEMVT
ncbi:MAG: hypothetical protein NVS4B11_00400 [Ktedonobacteraceae bacterium]